MTGTSPTTSSAMDEGFARRDLALVAVTVVGLSRLLEPPLIWIAAGALLGAMLLGTLQVLHDEAAPIQAWFGVPIESVILPSVAAVACLGAIRLVPFGLWLVPALGVDLLHRHPNARPRDPDQPRGGRALARRPDIACWSRCCSWRSWRSPAWPRWCPAVSPSPVGHCPRRT